MASGDCLAHAARVAGTCDFISYRERFWRPRRRGGASGAHGLAAQRAGRFSTPAARSARAPDPRHRGLRGARRLAYRGSRHQFPPHREPDIHGLSHTADGHDREGLRGCPRSGDGHPRCSPRGLIGARAAPSWDLEQIAECQQRARAAAAGDTRIALHALATGAVGPVHDERPCLGDARAHLATRPRSRGQRAG